MHNHSCFACFAVFRGIRDLLASIGIAAGRKRRLVLTWLPDALIVFLAILPDPERSVSSFAPYAR